jgi:hypothetical protein
VRLRVVVCVVCGRGSEEGGREEFLYRFDDVVSTEFQRFRRAKPRLLEPSRTTHNPLETAALGLGGKYHVDTGNLGIHLIALRKLLLLRPLLRTDVKVPPLSFAA